MIKRITFVDSDMLNSVNTHIGALLRNIEYRKDKGKQSEKITDEMLFEICLNIRNIQKEMILGNIKI
jgi:hypothetical protein